MPGNSDVCFSPGAIVLLGSIGGVLQAVIVALFWGWIRSLQDSIREAREERDRAATNLESSLQLGQRLAPPTPRRVVRR